MFPIAMQHEGICADAILWNTLILFYLEQSESKHTIVSFLQMQQEGLLLYGLILPSILKACGNVAAMNLEERLHAKFAQPRDSRPHMNI